MLQKKTFTSSLTVLLFALFTLAQSLHAQDVRQEAWTVLNAGLADKTASERAIAVRVLRLMTNDPQAPELAMKALDDPKPEVRAAGAEAVGQLRYQAAIPKLKEILLSDEDDVSVVLECAGALIEMGDKDGYAVYYAVLTGERKSGDSLVESHKKMLSDPKKMAHVGFEQGLGFVPFASVGYGVVKAVTKDDESPVRAAAAKKLIHDPDPMTQEALLNTSNDKSWVVRMAVVDSLARRNDPAAIPLLEPRLNDEKDVVKYTAAAAIVRLSDIQDSSGVPASGTPSQAPN